MKANWVAIGAMLGALAVITGALGAHGLKEKLTPEALELWHTAATYHILHAIALVLYGTYDREGRGRNVGTSFLLGILLFSGSIYALALGAPSWVGAITPFGGVLLVFGWLTFSWAARRR